MRLGPDRRTALPMFHAFTGCHCFMVEAIRLCVPLLWCILSIFQKCSCMRPHACMVQNLMYLRVDCRGRQHDVYLSPACQCQGLTHKLPGRRTALVYAEKLLPVSSNGVTGLNASTNSFPLSSFRLSGRYSSHTTSTLLTCCSCYSMYGMKTWLA